MKNLCMQWQEKTYGNQYHRVLLNTTKFARNLNGNGIIIFHIILPYEFLFSILWLVVLKTDFSIPIKHVEHVY